MAIKITGGSITGGLDFDGKVCVEVVCPNCNSKDLSIHNMSIENKTGISCFDIECNRCGHRETKGKS